MSIGESILLYRKSGSDKYVSTEVEFEIRCFHSFPRIDNFVFHLKTEKYQELIQDVGETYFVLVCNSKLISFKGDYPSSYVMYDIYSKKIALVLVIKPKQGTIRFWEQCEDISNVLNACDEETAEKIKGILNEKK